ncbi:MAG: terminase large subunit, partial [Leptolyngbya sp.]|nr:terminase large subunit [Leptolyngbya sp.]
HATDVVYQEFVAKPRENAYVAQVNWRDNPWFPDVLDLERREMLRTDPDTYEHIWEGGLWTKSDAQVLNGKWIVDEFLPGQDWDGPYYGADFGFAQDPTTLVELWIHNGRLFVFRESWAVRLELDATSDKWKRDCEGCDRFVIRADSARPESISYLKRHGIPRIVGASKWQGSVEDGIAHLRSYQQIVIHPRCAKAIEEARLWQYKSDPHTGDILPRLIDNHDHIWDAARYALAPLIKNRYRGMRQSMAMYG